MTRCPTCRLSSALQGGFLLRILQHSLRITNVSRSAKPVPHTTAESIIFHESHMLTTFCNVTSRPCPVIISNHFLAGHSIFHDVALLARLVKAEIMSPYCGILINTGMGNPTVLPARPLGNMQVSWRVGSCLIFTAFIRR